MFLKRKRQWPKIFLVVVSLWIVTTLLLFHPKFLVVSSAFTAATPQSKRTSFSPKRKDKNANSRSLSSSINNKNKKWFHQRKAGLTIPRGKKPPQWEKEGDSLFASSKDQQQVSEMMEPPQSVHEARELLRPLEETTPSFTTKESNPKDKEDQNDNMNKDTSNKPFLWGTLPVGPIWKNRLLRLGYQEPTPIQVETFHAVLSKTKQKRQNVVIASPTGSGKSLAFLLPFLSTLNMSQKANNAMKATSSSVGNCLDSYPYSGVGLSDPKCRPAVVCKW
jgi:hypothetical protein